VLADCSGTIMTWNAAAQNIFGYREEEVIGRPLTMLMPERYREAHQKGIERMSSSGTSQTSGSMIELRGLMKDGTEFPLELSLGTWQTAEGMQYAGIIRDLTARKHLEAKFLQAQKMDAIGHLSGGIAHDFNNMLTAIMGNAEWALAEMAPDAPQRVAIEEIREVVRRAAGLTRQLLAFSRKQVLAPRTLSLNDVVMGMEPMLRRLIGEDVVLRMTLAPDLGAVRADQGQIEQVIMNLAVNARDAMTKGGRLTIETANVGPGEPSLAGHAGGPLGPHVRLDVRDTGSGMDQETQAHLFEPFFTTKTPEKGTGLGLSTVYGIVRQSNGHVLVDSAPGQGTSVMLYFPLVDAEPDAPPHALREKDGHGTETILLVEDEEGVRRAVGTMLTRCGYTVLQARHSDDAFRLHGSHAGPIHLLLTDVVMPGMNGLELAERLRTARPAMKVLFMSGYTEDAILLSGVQTEKMAFLHKPFTMDDLTRKVRETLDATG
jgi:PAS domain S-box-containing protein